VVVYRLDGGGVGSLFGPDVLSLDAGETGRFRVTLDEMNLAPGKYVCEVLAGRGTPIEGRTEFDVVDDVLHFEVLPKKGTAGLPEFWEPVWGAVRLPPPALERVG
jgi:lipopolysaccharide transport system ATP-binding protein